MHVLTDKIREQRSPYYDIWRNLMGQASLVLESEIFSAGGSDIGKKDSLDNSAAKANLEISFIQHTEKLAQEILVDLS